MWVIYVEKLNFYGTAIERILIDKLWFQFHFRAHTKCLRLAVNMEFKNKYSEN